MAQLINSREKGMSKEEKLKLELMRTLAAGKGFNLREQTVDFNFRTGSNFSKMADFLLKRFDINFKNKGEENVFWPESDLKWDGKTEAKQEKKTEEKPQKDVIAEQTGQTEGIDVSEIPLDKASSEKGGEDDNKEENENKNNQAKKQNKKQEQEKGKTQKPEKDK